MNSTSLQTYDMIQKNLASKNKIIFELLKKEFRPMTNKEIANTLGWEINRVTGRVNELVESGLVKMVRKGKCPVTGYPATFWGYVKKDIQLEFEDGQ